MEVIIQNDQAANYKHLVMSLSINGFYVTNSLYAVWPFKAELNWHTKFDYTKVVDRTNEYFHPIYKILIESF